MEVTFQPILDKHYSKLHRAVSRNIYKHNKFRKIMSAGDFLLYLFFLIPSCYIAFKLMDWADYLYDYDENIFACWAGYILLFISLFAFIYAVVIRPYLYNFAFNNQVYREIKKEKTTVRIQEDGFYIGIDTCQTLYNYQCVRKVENKFDYFVIYISTGLFIAIPHSAFHDAKQQEDFTALLESKIIHR